MSTNKRSTEIRHFVSGRDGFTLLELVIVIAILSLSIIAPKMMGRADDAKIADAKITDKEPRNSTEALQARQRVLSGHGTGT